MQSGGPAPFALLWRVRILRQYHWILQNHRWDRSQTIHAIESAHREINLMNIRHSSWLKGLVWAAESHHMRAIHGCSWSNIESDLALSPTRKYTVTSASFVRSTVNASIEISSSSFLTATGLCANANKGKSRSSLHRLPLAADKTEHQTSKTAF